MNIDFRIPHLPQISFPLGTVNARAEPDRPAVSRLYGYLPILC